MFPGSNAGLLTLDPDNAGPWQSISTLGCGHPLVKTQRIPGPDVALVLLQARPVLRQDDTRLPGRNYSSLLSSLILSQKKEEGSGVPRQETGSS